MKCLLLFTSFTLFLGTFNANGQGNYFKSAVTSETDYPTANIPVRSNNTSAYSYGGLTIGGYLTNLFVFTWDQAQAGSIHDAGLAIRQSTPYAQCRAGDSPKYSLCPKLQSYRLPD